MNLFDGFSSWTLCIAGVLFKNIVPVIETHFLLTSLPCSLTLAFGLCPLSSLCCPHSELAACSAWPAAGFVRFPSPSSCVWISHAAFGGYILPRLFPYLTCNSLCQGRGKGKSSDLACQELHCTPLWFILCLLYNSHLEVISFIMCKSLSHAFNVL